MERNKTGTDIRLDEVAKIYPYARAGGLLGRKKRQELLERQRAMPYTTDEGVVVLQHISLTLEAGSFTAVLGPSGSGKTTLLRVLSGLEAPTVGEVWFGERRMNGLPPEEWNVAMVFQSYSLYPHLTVFDNVAFPLRNLHMPREELEAAVAEAAGLLRLEGCLDRLPAELSGGEQQRVAIARAMVRRPDLFLLDEPFSNLDPPLRRDLGEAVTRLHRELGTTFLYVTHDEQEAVHLGQRVLVLEDGKLARDVPAGDYFPEDA